MNILTDVLSLLKRKKYIETAKPEDVLVLGIHEEPEILGIASPIPYKDVKLIKVKDLTAVNCTYVNVPAASTGHAGVFKDVTNVNDECFVNLRRLKSLSLDLTIVENGDFIEFDLTIDDLNIDTVLTVTKSGNDTTAAVQKHDFHKPWLNPTVAMAAADVGDTVVVYPGVYKIGPGGLTDDGSQYMVKNGVTLYMMPGAVIHYTTTFNSPMSIPFFDNNVASIFNIRGRGTFIFDADTTRTVDYFLVTTNQASTVDWEFDSITIKRRWGSSSAATINFAKWRMVGRKYVNTESGVFEFRFPVESTAKLIDIDIEELIITRTYVDKIQWAVTRLVNLVDGHIVNIRYGTVTYPHAVDTGGFHENVACDDNSIINLTIDNIKRTGTDSYKDHIVFHNGDASKGTYTIKNIHTKKGLIRSIAATGGAACRTAYLQGNVYSNTNIADYMMKFETVNLQYKIELDIVHNGTSEYDFGIYAKDSNKVKISGYLSWANSLQEPIHLDFGSSVKALTVWNLMLSQIGSTYSVANINASNTVNLHVMNTFASKVIRPAGGAYSAITEDIGTITVDPVV